MSQQASGSRPLVLMVTEASPGFRLTGTVSVPTEARPGLTSEGRVFY